MPDPPLSLESLAAGLPTPSDPSTFSGKKIPGYEDRHLAKDGDENLLLLFHARPIHVPPAVILENLHVEHGVRCRVSNTDGTMSEGIFSIIQCTSSQASLRSYFLRVMDSVVELIPTPATSEYISTVVDRLATLFLALKHPPSGPVQGLWAELFLIVTAKSPSVLLDAWHIDSGERFDFSFGIDRIEVKSSGNRIRSHHFSYHQAYPPDDLSVFVASLFVEESAGGTSLGNLWDKAKSLAAGSPDLRLKVDQICVDVLGSDWERARERCFDYSLARHSLAFYDIRSIPKVPRDLPEGVSDVRFVSDLSRLSPVDPSKTSNSLLQSYFASN